VSESGSAVSATQTSTSTAKAVYVLYIVGWVIPIIAQIVGVIFAYIHRDDAPPWLQTHYQLQIRTFWIGLLYLVVGTILAIVIVGILVLLWWFIWSLVRTVKGVLALNENRPIANPGSWMFG